jgi:hypothetical protein
MTGETVVRVSVILRCALFACLEASSRGGRLAAVSKDEEPGNKVSPTDPLLALPWRPFLV